MDKLLPKLQKALQRIALGLCLLIFSHSSLLAASEVAVESGLKQLSYEERSLLRTLFCSFLKHDNFGHVLFCKTKPACFAAIDKNCHRKSYQQKLLLKGWECWKNHEHLFPHPNFLFLEEEYKVGDDTVFHIFIINKETLMASLHKNRDFFKEVLGSDFSPENFVLSIEKEGVLRPFIQHDEALLGLILGYGVESSMAFKSQHEGMNQESDWTPVWNENYTGVEAASPPKCRIHPIGFVGNPTSNEVTNLLNLYTQELEAIWKIYRSSKDPLQLTLEKLCTDI